MGKRRSGLSPGWIAFGILVGLLVLGFITLSPTGLQIGGDGVEAETVADVSPADCAVEDTTLTLRSFDVDNQGTATSETHSVWVNGQFSGTVADGGTTTVSPFDEVMVLFGNESESSNGYYPAMDTKTMTCSGTFTMTAFQKDKLSAATTITAFNSDDGLLNAAGDAQAVGSGAEETMELKLQGSSEDYYGETNVIIALDGSSTVYEELSIAGATEVQEPGQHSGGSGENTWAYEVVGLAGSGRDAYDLTIKAKDGQNPTGNHNVTVTLYDNSYYIDAETNLVELGYEDENDNDVGYLNTTATIVIS